MTNAKSTRASRPHVVSFRLSDDEAAHVDAAIEAMAAKWRRRSDWCRAAALHAAKARAPDPAPVRRQPRRLPSHDIRLLGQILGQLGSVSERLRDVGGSAPDVVRQATTEIRAIGDAVRRALSGGAPP